MTLQSFKYAKSGKVLSLGAITVGNATESLHIAGIDYLEFEFTVASIGTNVVVRAEISLDGTNWVNADVGGTDTIITENGTYIMEAKFSGLYVYARLTWVSASAGSPTIATSNVTVRS